VLLAVFVICVLLFVILPVVGATLTSLLWTLLVGLVIGALGRAIAPGSGRMGCLTTSLVGVAGALIGQAAAHWLDVDGRLGRWLLEVGAATVLVMVLRPSKALSS
jgi:uncharacterized membrane protein YeaQ/YmgE (transglycosylase-associated protein family)